MKRASRACTQRWARGQGPLTLLARWRCRRTQTRPMTHLPDRSQSHSCSHNHSAGGARKALARWRRRRTQTRPMTHPPPHRPPPSRMLPAPGPPSRARLMMLLAQKHQGPAPMMLLARKHQGPAPKPAPPARLTPRPRVRARCVSMHARLCVHVRSGVRGPCVSVCIQIRTCVCARMHTRCRGSRT